MSSERERTVSIRFDGKSVSAKNQRIIMDVLESRGDILEELDGSRLSFRRASRGGGSDVNLHIRFADSSSIKSEYGPKFEKLSLCEMDQTHPKIQNYLG